MILVSLFEFIFSLERRKEKQNKKSERDEEKITQYEGIKWGGEIGSGREREGGRDREKGIERERKGGEERVEEREREWEVGQSTIKVFSWTNFHFFLSCYV